MVRCPRCGNENQETNRFCGMCGATLLPPAAASANAPQRASSSAASSVSAAAPPARTDTQRPPATSDSSVSGPSFLGLNDPPARKRNSLSIDPHSGSSDVDYLLADDEPSHRGSGGKIFVTLILLALAAGFGYMTWKNQGLGWLSSKKQAATQDSGQNPPTDSSQPSQGVTPNPESQPAAPTSQPAAKTPENPAPPADNSTNTTNAKAAPTGDDGNSGNAPDAASKTNAANQADNEGPAPEKAPAAAPPAPVARAEKPKHSAPLPKPRAAVAARATDPVTEAQKYLYGRGAAQDCDHGLRILKPAANSGNANAMIEMGALYSAGLCAPHDLPTAYHWFAVALRKDPNNQTAQNDLTKLWSEMTQPERQLAIKLTQ